MVISEKTSLLLCQQVHNPPDAHKPALVIIGVEVVVANATVPGGMNKFDSVANHFGYQANMTDLATARTVAFKQNQVAGLGIVAINGFTNVSLSSTGVG